jgi:hypothetical protein
MLCGDILLFLVILSGANAQSKNLKKGSYYPRDLTASGHPSGFNKLKMTKIISHSGTSKAK